MSIGAIPIRTYLDKVFDIRHEDIGHYMLVNLTMILVLRVLAALHQPPEEVRERP